jgi:hypothetical protein
LQSQYGQAGVVFATLVLARVGSNVGKEMKAIVDWANANQGVLALLALVVTIPTLLILAYKSYRQLIPAKYEREAKIKNEFIDAAALKKEVEARTKWDDQVSYYGEFLIRDTGRRLPKTDEVHSSVTTPHCIAVLTHIHNEYLEFTTGSFSIRYIKKIGDGWYFSEEQEDGAVKVQAVFRLRYRDIVIIRWDTNDYWEWPQVCCRFTRSNKFPFSYAYYAREGKLGSRSVLLEVCPVSKVSSRPKGWA